MLRHEVIVLTSAVCLLLVLMKCVSADRNVTIKETNCEVTDIDTRLKIATDLIAASRQMLTKDVKEFCRATECDSPDCQKCTECSSEAVSQYQKTIKPIDCSDIYRTGNQADGIYEIWPQSRLSKGPVRVYCDMTTDGGGWTVIQRRGEFGNPQDYFFKPWADYKTGFGDLLREFWIGNDNIFMVTNQRFYKLSVELMTWDDASTNFTFDNFWIDDESNNYKLHVATVSSGVGYSLSHLNGMAFSTKDRDNDPSSSANVATTYKGGWWYYSTSYSNINGPRLAGTDVTGKGMAWYYWGNSYRSLKASAMKIRPANFHLNGIV